MATSQKIRIVFLYTSFNYEKVAVVLLVEKEIVGVVEVREDSFVLKDLKTHCNRVVIRESSFCRCIPSLTYYPKTPGSLGITLEFSNIRQALDTYNSDKALREKYPNPNPQHT